MKFRLVIDKDAQEEIIAVVHKESDLTRQIENLVRSFSVSGNIIGFTEDEKKILDFDVIECITVIDRKVVVIDNSGKRYRIQERLRELENVLPYNFIRINKSTLANENCIVKFDAVFSGAVDAIFKCGYKDYVSRRCFSQIKRRFDVK